jgi:hypothetical protein
MMSAEEETRPILALALACGTLAVVLTWGIALAITMLGRRGARRG